MYNAQGQPPLQDSKSNVENPLTFRMQFVIQSFNFTDTSQHIQHPVSEVTCSQKK